MSLSLSKFVWEAVRICVEYVTEHLSKGYTLKEGKKPFAMGYCPDFDVSPVLGPEEAY